MEQFISFANKRETKFQSRFVIGSSIVLALLCSSLNAIEADFTTDYTLNLSGSSLDGDTIKVGTPSSKKSFELDKITEANGVAYMAGASKNNDITDYTLNANINSVVYLQDTVVSLIGAFSENGNVFKNKINVTQTPKTYKRYLDVYGGYTMRANKSANKNIVTILNSNITGGVLGGYSKLGSANLNKVIIKASSVDRDVAGGNSSIGNSNSNEVYIEQGTAVAGDVFGGGQYYNKVFIKSSSINGEVYGGEVDNGDTTKNSVTINSSNIVNNIYGGYSNNGNAFLNTVTVASSNINSIVGGASENGNAINNTVNISHTGGRNKTKLGKYFLVKGKIYGGNSDKGKISGNTLNVKGKDLIAGNIANFENANFYLPKDITTNDIVLQLTNDEDTVLNNVKVIPNEEDGKVVIKNFLPNNKIYIIKKAHIDSELKATDNAEGKLIINGTQELTKNKYISELGASATYDLKLQNDGSNLLLLSAEGTVEPSNPGTVEPSNPGKPIVPNINAKINHALIPNLASTAVVNKSDNDIIKNISNINAIIDNNVSTNTDNLISFAYIEGYKSNIDKNDIDIDGVNVTAGVASRSDNILGGVFLEYAYGDYDGKANSYKSDGDINAYALGALARFDLPYNLFIDSYAKIGRLNNDYTLKGYDNLNVDKDSTFYSLGVFLGHNAYFDSFNLENRIGYAYANVNGYDININGETLKLKDITSQRIKYNGTAYYQTNENTNVYATAKLEYEFDNESELYAPNINKNISSKNDGFSAGGEVGAIYAINPLSNISFGLGAMGGKVDELSANLKFVYEF
ncbi:autotransporter outer membrane beta-barrel domain-containing protein [Campylobacter hominis]|uniref:Putative high-molecular-weight surface-exposed protein n=1 Tax=Campylobacter hominis (strain ATCC BAA-381 / DSM 21671 / CCUG 45161 / LMG 19568 / NCTC 13146 / CH001A) TaxID=360107 RepID=A7I306_CAMHC|nr:autotransporter outer membrane beta-barrel domain-containing protein [Campylobacter hominis]ABS51306.1 putative high-molecular-weight surface-exposed protein [Campylobacter hominis ATCC BAA-381]UAK85865.1 autotransporter outer membrane beta-barrel domain-containing protein [Campylobacter hominis]SUW85411.1 putative high-molecular-weight surface-exposed protein [Campylobacter hominis]